MFGINLWAYKDVYKAYIIGITLNLLTPIIIAFCVIQMIIKLSSQSMTIEEDLCSETNYNEHLSLFDNEHHLLNDRTLDTADSNVLMLNHGKLSAAQNSSYEIARSMSSNGENLI